MRNKEIAQILNISPAAVSMALNNKGGVSESTKKKILELKYAAPKKEEEAEHKKGSLLFSIHKKHGNVIAETHFFVTVMDAIQKQADALGYYVNIVHYEPSLPIEEFMGNVNMEEIKGILLLATEMNGADLAYYQKWEKPLVILDNWFAGRNLDCVLMDNVDGIIQAVAYACRKGHRKIGFVGSRTKLHNFQERYEGYKQGLRRAGLPYQSQYVYETRCSTEGACQDMLELLKEEKDWPSILIVSNDVMAIGIMNAFKQSGYQVGKDISIIGFDNMPIDQYLEPPLTSINIQNEKIGQIAVRRLVEKIEEDENDYSVHNQIGVNLVERKSVRDLTDI